MSKNIVILIGTFNRGGAERVCSIISNYLVSKGWKVSIILILGGPLEYELDSRINIYRIGRDKSHFKKIKELRHYYKEIKPDMILSFMAQESIIGYLALLGMPITFFTTERNDPVNSKRSFVIQRLYEIVMKKAFLNILQTQKVKELYSKRGIKNTIVISNPINIKIRTNYENKNRLISVGRLENVKNQQMLINVFSQINLKYPSSQLDIYGNGSLELELNNLIQSKNLSGKVKIHNATKQIQQKMAASSIFVLPSNYEGLSNALMEAMAIGLPCISTDCNGSDELIKNEFNGLIIPVKDEQALFCAIDVMISNPEKAKAMGIEASKVGSNNSVEKICCKWENALSSNS